MRGRGPVDTLGNVGPFRPQRSIFQPLLDKETTIPIQHADDGRLGRHGIIEHDRIDIGCNIPCFVRNLITDFLLTIGSRQGDRTGGRKNLPIGPGFPKINRKPDFIDTRKSIRGGKIQGHNTGVRHSGPVVDLDRARRQNGIPDGLNGRGRTLFSRRHLGRDRKGFRSITRQGDNGRPCGGIKIRHVLGSVDVKIGFGILGPRKHKLRRVDESRHRRNDHGRCRRKFINDRVAEGRDISGLIANLILNFFRGIPRRQRDRAGRRKSLPIRPGRSTVHRKTDPIHPTQRVRRRQIQRYVPRTG